MFASLILGGLTDVLNLVINGLPSIQKKNINWKLLAKCSFKPCYKWITFNTDHYKILNGIIHMGFKPCYKWITFNTLTSATAPFLPLTGFKPCYKWITFNTETKIEYMCKLLEKF